MYCNYCSKPKTRSEFSKNQLKKKQYARKCGVCCLTNIQTNKTINLDDTFKKLILWLKSHGAIFPSLNIKKHNDTYRSVVAQKRILTGANILQIPKECIITTLDAQNSHIGQKVSNSEFEPRSTHTWLALYILQEKFSNVSFFKPYLDILPRHYNNFPSFYKPAEITKLKGSFALDMLKGRKIQLELEYNNFIHCLPEYTNIVQLGLENNVRTEGLVPMADMLNHKEPAGTSWKFETGTNSFVIRSTKMHLKGGEIFDTYGGKCNSRYLINYGFTLPDNQNNNQAALFVDPELILDSVDCTAQLSEEKYLLLGQCRSYEDGYTGYIVEHKSKIIRFQFGIIPKRFEKHQYLDQSTPSECIQSCFSILRVLLCNQSEFEDVTDRILKDMDILVKKSDKMKYILQKGLFRHITVSPLSASNELLVLRFLSDSCQTRLLEFNNDIDTDQKQSTLLEPMSNDYNICMLLISEKEVLRWYIDLAVFVNESWNKHHNVRSVNRDIKQSKFRPYSSMFWNKLI
jgi:hypothetical protein